jgi:hypothetical protein
MAVGAFAPDVFGPESLLRVEAGCGDENASFFFSDHHLQ